MIKSLKITKLRGIREGSIAGLAPLTVLIGPSGSGKSTILDALLLGLSGSPGDAIGRVVKRRSELVQGAQWLFEKKGQDAVIEVEGDEIVKRVCSLELDRLVNDDELLGRLSAAEQMRRPVQINFVLQTNFFDRFRGSVVISAGGEYAFDLERSGLGLAPDAELRSRLRDQLVVRMIEPAAGSNHATLDTVYSNALTSGAISEVNEIVAKILDGATGLTLASEDDYPHNRPALHVTYRDHSVPVAGSGSGIYSLVRLALDLAGQSGGVALVEEPESHEHPAAIALSARVVREAVRRGVQVILSTHSLEFIDGLLFDATEEDLAKMLVLRTVLDGGHLRVARFPGTTVAAARDSLHEDLR